MANKRKIKFCEECKGEIRGWKTFCSRKCYGKHKSKTPKIDKQKFLDYYYDHTKIEIMQHFNISDFTFYNYAKKYNLELKGQHTDYSNQKIGRLQILDSFQKPGNDKHYIWNAICDCGNKCTISSGRLYKNLSIKLQCSKCSKIERRSKDEFSDGHFNIIKKGGFDRFLDFNVDKKYLWELFLKQERKCALSGEELVFAPTAKLRAKGEGTASLDRINSDKGYIEGNVQWVHKDVNRIKWELKEKDFFDWCVKIVKHNNLLEKENG